jgi:hypothetical protein
LRVEKEGCTQQNKARHVYKWKIQWSENLKGNHLEDLGIKGKIILKWISKTKGRGMQTGFIWARVGTRGRLL